MAPDTEITDLLTELHNGHRDEFEALPAPR